MTAYHASFHDSGSSISNPITISDSPPLPPTSSNPPAPTSPPISTRTRSHDPSTCEHRYLTWWETTIDGIIKMCDRCHQTFKEPFKNSQ